MLTCVYHPIDSMRVVEEDDAEKLRASGVWFDSPILAKEYRAKVEQDITKEKAEKADTEKKMLKKPNEKLKEKSK